VNVGTAEILYHEIKVFSERMRQIEGNKIDYIETKDGPHDTLLNCWFTGLIGEAERVIERTGMFLGVRNG
jgi:hypothetical protein